MSQIVGQGDPDNIGSIAICDSITLQYTAGKLIHHISVISEL